MTMTSAQLRQSFLDFFQARQHTIVPSSSLLPDSPNLLFTNAGMNQFVPIFLGQLACPYQPGRAADTQKCIRAGGKHNDLEDVGLDTYHHTFFEMLGNWSFGDYFKKESLSWGWELLTRVWGFPANRLYATVYRPDPAKGDPAAFDQEAYDIWAEIFRAAGLDPAVHIVAGGKKDNFWMMGDTGPCGPCSEIHVDLTPGGDTRGALVNKGSAECIEIWNHVFIQFNANADGSFGPLPARHVDTGMGFERVAGIMQCTKNFTDFSRPVSNYESDVFRPIFDELQRLSGKRYASTLPAAGSTGANEQERTDVAFRVIADHIRTLSFAIADGIRPGNTERHYVLRRILRRAVRYGRSLGFHQPFFYKLVDVLAAHMGDAFPEIRRRQEAVKETIRVEEEAFNRTLDRGIELFNEEASGLAAGATLSGDFSFKLYDTFGFPLDLTQLMAREKGMDVDLAGFERNMDQQRARARAAQKKEVIEVSQIQAPPTAFTGYDHAQADTRVIDVVQLKGRTAVIVEASPLYAEMGGQVGDTGELAVGGRLWRVLDTQKAGGAWLHFIDGDEAPAAGDAAVVRLDGARRAAIQRHHSVTHLLHWALHEVVSRDATQKGSYVGPEKLTFDFSSAALTPQQVVDVERLVNERIVENAAVSWREMPYAEVKKRPEVMQFFGDKYGDTVRVVQIGGKPGVLDGYSMELCGGTHARATGELGGFRIVAESSVAAGIRRIEAVCGLPAWEAMRHDRETLRGLSARLSVAPDEVAKRVEALQEQLRQMEKDKKEAAKADALRRVDGLVGQQRELKGRAVLVADAGEMEVETLRLLADGVRARMPAGVMVLGAANAGKVAFIASASDDAVAAGVHCGKLIGAVAKLAGGGGGGKPNKAEAGGKDATKLRAALDEAIKILGA